MLYNKTSVGKQHTFHHEKEISMNNSSAERSAEQKAQVQAYFSRTAASYVASTSHRTGSDLQRLIELGEFSPQQCAIDIATGGGHTALAVAPHVGQVMVTDLTPTMLEQARTYILAQGITNAQFQVADAEALPFANNTFDRATCRIAPHHFPNIAQAVREVARILKPSGLFLLIDNIAPADPALDAFINKVEKWRDPSHGRSCTEQEWRTFFTQAGFQVEHGETSRHTYQYDEWTARSQMPNDEKARLEQFILTSDEQAKRYFAITQKADGHLEGISSDKILLIGRKQ